MRPARSTTRANLDGGLSGDERLEFGGLERRHAGNDLRARRVLTNAWKRPRRNQRDNGAPREETHISRSASVLLATTFNQANK